MYPWNLTTDFIKHHQHWTKSNHSGCGSISERRRYSVAFKEHTWKMQSLVEYTWFYPLKSVQSDLFKWIDQENYFIYLSEREIILSVITVITIYNILKISHVMDSIINSTYNSIVIELRFKILLRLGPHIWLDFFYKIPFVLWNK